MRYKPEHKQETHQRIVEAAAKEFRTHGFDGVGIARLMADLKLTHGGFYAHFEDKEGLITESLALAANQILEVMLKELETGGLPALLDFYLGAAHLNEPGIGCMLPALTAEIARRPVSSREAFTGKLAEVFGAVESRLPGPPSAQKRANVGFLFASLSGAVSLARAVSDPRLSKSILESTRAQLLSLFREDIG